MSYAAAARYLPEARRLGVSEVARGPGGFMSVYRRHGRAMKSLPVYPGGTWGRKRDAFVARHLPQYRAHPTYRRWLALVMWAYRAPLP